MRYFSLVLVLALVNFAGCVDQPTPVANVASSPNKPSPQNLAIGDSVDGLNVAGLLQADGKESISLGELAGNTIILEFWATW